MTKKLPLELKQSRKPIQTACVFCHEKHLQCDVGRPCQNCIKRNIGYLCRDKVRKARKRSSNLGETLEGFNKKDENGGAENRPLEPMKPLVSGPILAVDLASLKNADESDKSKSQEIPGLRKVESLNTILNNTSNSFLNDPLIPNMGPPSNTDLKNCLDLQQTKDVRAPSNMDFDSMWAGNEYMKLNDITAMYPNDFSKRTPVEGLVEGPVNGSLSSQLYQYAAFSKSDSRPFISLEMARGNSAAGTDSRHYSDLSAGASNASELSPYRLRQLIKTPNDLFEKKYLIKPHNYRAAYKQLLRCLHYMFVGGVDRDAALEKQAPDECSSTSSEMEKLKLRARQLRYIAKSIVNVYMPTFVTLTSNMIEDDLLLQEIILQRSLLEYESMAKLVNCTPICIWRRSGEICFVSNEFTSLTGFTKKEILNNRRFIVELLDHQSVVEYFDLFHESLAFGPRENRRNTTSCGEAVFSKCKLLVNNGSFLKCTCCWSVKRDSFNISLLVMGQFLPIFDVD